MKFTITDYGICTDTGVVSIDGLLSDSTGNGLLPLYLRFNQSQQELSLNTAIDDADKRQLNNTVFKLTGYKLFSDDLTFSRSGYHQAIGSLYSAGVLKKLQEQVAAGLLVFHGVSA